MLAECADLAVCWTNLVPEKGKIGPTKKRFNENSSTRKVIDPNIRRPNLWGEYSSTW
jgi:hypothetical protein